MELLDTLLVLLPERNVQAMILEIEDCQLMIFVVQTSFIPNKPNDIEHINYK